jgi:hypothetical protein
MTGIRAAGYRISSGYALERDIAAMTVTPEYGSPILDRAMPAGRAGAQRLRRPDSSPG